MKTRLAAIVASLAIGLAVAAAALIGVTVATLDDASETSVAAHAAAPVKHRPVEQSAPAAPELEPVASDVERLPTEADIPADWPDAERADALLWLDYQRIVDECMASSGFEHYTYSAWWMSTSTIPHGLLPALPWATDAEKDDAKLALDGTTGGGADYHWEDAGCNGLASHQLNTQS